ncbi:MAG: BCAM0308 family protein [Candidatus Geothermincolia bacterium]
MKLCPKCGAIWDGERWVPEPDEALRKEFEKKHHCAELCPGDLRIEKKQVEGIVTLKGKFLASHKLEINNLVGRVARDARKRNVAARILQSVEDDDTLVLETTDEHLAEKMGKEVEKAFKGALEIKWQKKDTFARVNWHRD